MSYLSIEQLDKSFVRGNLASQVLKNINLRIDKGEFISIIGHSGCGKSTVLNIVAGLLDPSLGVVILDGKEVLANSGAAGVYEGPQVWSEATYAYHPGDPSGDVYGARGYPTIPGMLEAAISTPVSSQGLPVPWYAVYGNHDATYMGTFRPDPALFAWAVGDRKAATGDGLAVLVALRPAPRQSAGSTR